MLSVRRRQEDAGGRVAAPAPALQQPLGGLRMDDDAELEEGEACGDDTAFVDPDVALSYIDEKLQDVLGHFQKDFEGGVSAENLGSKFGGYGSFLPTYQRSPLPQTRSPPKASTVTSKSPFHQSSEGMSQKPPAVAVSSTPQSNGPMVPFSGDSIKKEMRPTTKAERGSISHDSYGPSKCSDQNRLKVRIKVGSDNVLARNNAAIYSGLGLDISSPSSIEDSPDGRGSLSPEVNNVPHESPQTILQIMTCFSVPGGFLLSPLPANILQLTKKVVASSKKWEPNVDTENVQEPYEGHVAKKVKSDGKKKKLVDAKNSKNRNDISAVMKKEIDIETVAGQKIVSEALNISLLSDPRAVDAKGENRLEEEPAESNLGGTRDARLKERSTKTDSMTIKVEPAKTEAMECLENSSFGSSEMDLSAAKGESKPKIEKGETTLEERNTTNDKDLMLDRKQEKKIKPESKYNASNFEGSNVINERAPAVSRSMGKVSGKETLPYDTNGESNSRSEVKTTIVRHLNTFASAVNIVEHILGKGYNAILDIQVEMAIERKSLDHTAAGQYLLGESEQLRAKYERELEDLKEALEEAKDDDDLATMISEQRRENEENIRRVKLSQQELLVTPEQMEQEQQEWFAERVAEAEGSTFEGVTKTQREIELEEQLERTEMDTIRQINQLRLQNKSTEKENQRLKKQIKERQRQEQAYRERMLREREESRPDLIDYTHSFMNVLRRGLSFKISTLRRAATDSKMELGWTRPRDPPLPKPTSESKPKAPRSRRTKQHRDFLGDRQDAEEEYDSSPVRAVEQQTALWAAQHAVAIHGLQTHGQPTHGQPMHGQSMHGQQSIHGQQSMHGQSMHGQPGASNPSQPQRLPRGFENPQTVKYAVDLSKSQAPIPLPRKYS